MSIARLSAGAGYRYLLKNIAVGDIELGPRVQLSQGPDPLMAYYAATGNPPGRWLGRALSAFGGAGLRPGEIVTEKAMAASTARVSIRSPVSNWVARIRCSSPPLSGLPTRLPACRLSCRRRPERRRSSASRSTCRRVRRGPRWAGFDLTFTVPKSASVLWALGDEIVQTEVVAAHRAAIDGVLELIEDRFLHTRVGAQSCAQVPAWGLIAAAFDHFDSRAQDPHLHPSARTVAYLHALIRTALAHAVREDLLPRNLARQVQVSAGERTEIDPLTIEEAQKIPAAAEKDRLHAIYAVALGVGLRRGEALGLRWEDIDLDPGVLRVRQTVQRAGGKLVFVPPKTQRSRRAIPLLPQLVTALTEHRDRQDLERLAAGERWHEHGLVFTTTIGTPIEPRNLNRSFTALCDSAGIRRIRLHDLRHTCATLLLVQGVDLRMIMEILGHSAIAVTGNLYTHVKLDTQRTALDKLTGLFGSGNAVAVAVKAAVNGVSVVESEALNEEAAGL